MFKFFKKKNVEKAEKAEKLEIIFPTAEDMLKETSEKWPAKSAEEILQGIKRGAAKGERYAWFFRSRISERTIKELRQQGYRIEVGTHEDAPYFKIFW